jgi:hypothetical protein
MLEIIEKNPNFFIMLITFIGYLISLEYRLKLNKNFSKSCKDNYDRLSETVQNMQEVIGEVKEMVAEIKGFLRSK